MGCGVHALYGDFSRMARLSLDYAAALCMRTADTRLSVIENLPFGVPACIEWPSQWNATNKVISGYILDAIVKYDMDFI
jgi:hypothetical protein